MNKEWMAQAFRVCKHSDFREAAISISYNTFYQLESYRFKQKHHIDIHQYQSGIDETIRVIFILALSEIRVSIKQ